MYNARTPKIFLYGRVHKGASKQGKYFSYFNSVKSLLREYQIEGITLDIKKSKLVHENYIKVLREICRLWKAETGHGGGLR